MPSRLPLRERRDRSHIPAAGAGHGPWYVDPSLPGNRGSDRASLEALFFCVKKNKIFQNLAVYISIERARPQAIEAAGNKKNSSVYIYKTMKAASN